MLPQRGYRLLDVLEPEDARVGYQERHQQPDLAAEMRIGIPSVAMRDDLADEGRKGAPWIGKGSAIAVAGLQRTIARLADTNLVLEDRHEPAERIARDGEREPVGRAGKDLVAFRCRNVLKRGNSDMSALMDQHVAACLPMVGTRVQIEARAFDAHQHSLNRRAGGLGRFHINIPVGERHERPIAQPREGEFGVVPGPLCPDADVCDGYAPRGFRFGTVPAAGLFQYNDLLQAFRLAIGAARKHFRDNARGAGSFVERTIEDDGAAIDEKRGPRIDVGLNRRLGMIATDEEQPDGTAPCLGCVQLCWPGSQERRFRRSPHPATPQNRWRGSRAGPELPAEFRVCIDAIDHRPHRGRHCLRASGQRNRGFAARRSDLNDAACPRLAGETMEKLRSFLRDRPLETGKVDGVLIRALAKREFYKSLPKILRVRQA